MSKQKLLIVGLAAVAVAAAAGFLVFSGNGDKPAARTAERAKKGGLIKDAGKDAAARAKKIEKAKKAKKVKKTKKAGKKGGKAKSARKQWLKHFRKAARNSPSAPVEDRFENLPEAERKVADTLQAALDSDDQSAVLKAAEAAMRSSSAEVRQLAVESLSWCGSKALPELTAMMADESPEVAEAAMDAVQNALTEIEDPLTQFRTAQSYMATFKDNEDALTMFSGILSSSAGDILSNDETPAATQLDNRKVIAETFGQMIGEGGPYAEKAKETYRDITGSDWKDAADAARWAADPDAYAASDD